jgi:uncharacterized membrane protein YfcA
MFSLAPDPQSILFVVIGAFVAGFVTGFAGFGTGLVASGFWFHVLPAPLVPPLVVLGSVAGQLTSFQIVRKSFDWQRVTPFLIGGALGVPLGVLALAHTTPSSLRLVIGILLMTYSALQLSGFAGIRISPRVNRNHDAAIGLGAGILGGFAGLSGLLPLIWLQLKGGASDMQRAIYQPFNLVILSAAGVVMLIAGQITPEILIIAMLCLPATITGAFIGARMYKRVSERWFRVVVLTLLLASGLMLIVQTLFERG